MEKSNREQIINIIKNRKKNYPKNSRVWWFSNFIEVKEDEEIVWTIEKILTYDERQKKCNFSKEFLEIQEGRHYVQCMLCDKKIPYSFKSKSCSDMAIHVVEKHYTELDDNNIGIFSKEDYAKCINADEKTKLLNLTYLAFILTSHSPFAISDNTFLNKFVSLLNKEYKIPSRNTISNTLIPMTVKTVKDKIKDEIKISKSFCCTIDGWETPYNRKSFLSFTIHYIKDMKMVNRCLKLSRFEESHTGENIKKFINDTMEEYGIPKPTLILSDNANNMKAAIRESGNLWIGCPCHKLATCLKKATENSSEINQTVNKFKRISYRFKNTLSLNNSLEKLQREQNSNIINVLIPPETRWFCEIFTCERVIKLSNNLNKCINEYKNDNMSELQLDIFKSDYIIQENEIELVSFFIDIIKPIYEKSMDLSSENTCSMAYLIPSIKSILNDLKNMKSNLNEEENEKEISLIEISSVMNENEQSVLFTFDDCEKQNVKYDELSISNKIMKYNLNEVKMKFIDNLINEIEKRFINKNNIYKDEICIMSRVASNKFDV